MSNGNQGIGSFLPSQYGTDLGAAQAAATENINQMMAASQASIPTVAPRNIPMSGMFGLQRESLPTSMATEESENLFDPSMYHKGLTSYGQHLAGLDEPAYYGYVGGMEREGRNYLTDPNFIQGEMGRDPSLGLYDERTLTDFGIDRSTLPTLANLQMGEDVSYQDFINQFYGGSITDPDEAGRLIPGSYYDPQYSGYGEYAAEQDAMNQVMQQQGTSYMTPSEVIGTVYPEGFENYLLGTATGQVPQSPVYGINQPGYELYSALMQRPDLYQQLNPQDLSSQTYGNIQQYLPEGFGGGTAYGANGGIMSLYG